MLARALNPAVLRTQGLRRQAMRALPIGGQTRNTTCMSNCGRYLPDSPVPVFYNSYFDRGHPDNRAETYQMLDAHVAPHSVAILDDQPTLQEWRAQLEKEGKRDPFWYMTPEERSDYCDATREYAIQSTYHGARYSSENVAAFYGRAGGDVTSRWARILLVWLDTTYYAARKRFLLQSLDVPALAFDCRSLLHLLYADLAT
ncbi:unnamed protein product [Amoebophrya sp. A25]|nr:unnamed protein product [Amoebophrya sp. A25]|eukprot:GSA25T00016789001.1